MKPITEERALERLAGECAKSEHCAWELRQKMMRWGLDDDAQERILEYLESHKFIDEERYCRAFINDKLLYDRWGRHKIEFTLRQKHIDSSVFMPLLDEVNDEQYIEQLRPMALQKWKTITAASDYDRAQKLIRWAMGRGYDIDIIKKSLNI